MHTTQQHSALPQTHTHAQTQQTHTFQFLPSGQRCCPGRVGVTMMFSVCLSFSLQRKQQDREAAFAADQALIAESRRIMDLKEQQRKDEIQRRADKIQV